jgi:hypothetical protein
MGEKKPKRGPGGRPTKYKPEYAAMILEHLSGGLSVESFGGIVGVSRASIYQWEIDFPEFSDSIKAGREASYLFWERLGRAAGTGKIPGFNAAVWIFTMKNRFGWRDKTEVEHSGSMTLEQLVVGSTKEK